LEAVVKYAIKDQLVLQSLGNLDLAEFCIVSGFDIGSAGDVRVTKTTHHKCGRCWRHLPEVSEDGTLCNRCEEVVNG
jgi:isoleucyl-tRNA synthetase